METLQPELRTDHPPARVSTEDMEGFFASGPVLSKGAVLVVLQGRMYKREGNCWYLLESIEDVPASDGS